MKGSTVLGGVVCFALTLSVYTEAQQPATFHGEISDSQCAFNVHSLTKSHDEMLKSKSGAMGSTRSSFLSTAFSTWAGNLCWRQRITFIT